MEFTWAIECEVTSDAERPDVGPVARQLSGGSLAAEERQAEYFYCTNDWRILGWEQ